MRKEDFTGLFEFEKTLVLGAKPVGRTRETFDKNDLMSEATERLKNMKKVSLIMDSFHREFIERVLLTVKLKGLDEYLKLLEIKGKTKEDWDAIYKAKKELGDSISLAFTTDPMFKSLISAKELITNVLPPYVTDEEKELLALFNRSTTLFKGYEAVREYIYKNEGKHGSISYRILEDNLPIFAENMKVAEEVLSVLPKKDIDALKKTYPYAFKPVMFNDLEYFNSCLAQEGITKYNDLIGGFTLSTGEKVQGLNEYINMYEQDKKVRLPKFKMLQKQILSVSESTSFNFIKGFESDEVLMETVNEFFRENAARYKALEKLFDSITKKDLADIYVERNKICNVSHLLGGFNLCNEGRGIEYDNLPENASKNKETKKYQADKRKALNKLEVLSLEDIEKYVNMELDFEERKNVEVLSTIKSEAKGHFAAFNALLLAAKGILSKPYTSKVKLANNDEYINLLEPLFLEAIEINRFVRNFIIKQSLEGKGLFHQDIEEIYDYLIEATYLSNRIASHLEKKPFSTDKVMLDFNVNQFMEGWDINKADTNRTTILEKDGEYFLLIFPYVNIFANKFKDEFTGTGYRRMIYKQIPKASNYISLHNILPKNPAVPVPAEIEAIIRKANINTKKSLTPEEVHTYVKWLQDAWLKEYPTLKDENGNDYFNFKFKKPEEYDLLDDFLNDLQKQAYSVRFSDVSAEYIDNAVDEGACYMFKFWTKDFSKESKGKPNLNTSYFLELFSEDNLKEKAITLLGSGMMFIRPASLSAKDVTVHKAGKEIKRKQSDGISKFPYDIVKDKRYMEDHFEVHLTVRFNKTAGLPDKMQKRLDLLVRKQIQEGEYEYVIGLDRGERNLVTVCVLDKGANIIEQKSLNVIGDVDYRKLILKRLKEKKNGQRSWGRGEYTEKAAKDGYISQAVHEIAKLIEKYNYPPVFQANLSQEIKHGRDHFCDRAMYEKVEMALSKKLNYLVFKDRGFGEIGGVRKGLQLSYSVRQKKDKTEQNGLLFYFPPYRTSDIDPATGFVNGIYVDAEKCGHGFFDRFDDIRYNKKEGFFEFDTDFEKFDVAVMPFVKKWTICTVGDRLINKKNEMGEWICETIDITSEIKALMVDNLINYTKPDLKNQILAGKVGFRKELARLFKLACQIRNTKACTDIDYIMSCVRDKGGNFFDSRKGIKNMPDCGDTNGAYHIALKGLVSLEKLNGVTDEDALSKVKLGLGNSEWLEFVQKRHI